MVTNSCSLITITLTIILNHGCKAIDPGTSITLLSQTISTKVLIDQLGNALRQHDFSAEQRYGQHIYHRTDGACIDSWHVQNDEYQAWPAKKEGECSDLTKATQQWRFDGRALKTGSKEQFPLLQGDACLDCFKHEVNCLLFVYSCTGGSNQNFFLRIHPDQISPIKTDQLYFSIHSEWSPSQCLTRGSDYHNYGVFRLEECWGTHQQSFYLKLDNDRGLKRELLLIRQQLIDSTKPSSKPKDYSVDVSFSLEDYYKSGKLIHIKNLPDSCFGVDSSSEYGSQEINGQSYYSTRAVSCGDAKDSGQLWRLMNRRTRLELGSKVDNFPDLSGNFPCLECVGEDQDCSLFIGSCVEKSENQDFAIRERNVVSNSSAYFSIHSRKYPNRCITLYQVDDIYRFRLASCDENAIKDEQLLYLHFYFLL